MKLPVFMTVLLQEIRRTLRNVEKILISFFYEIGQKQLSSDFEVY